MKITLIERFLIAAAIISAPMARFEAAQTSAVDQEGQRDIAPGTGTEFWIVGNAQIVMMQSHWRMIAVFMQPQEYTTESLKSVFLHLSEKYPEEDFLWIDALSNDSQAEVAKRWFAEIQSFPFGNVLPPPRCASPPDPLSATYCRHYTSERFIYYPATGTPEGIVVELKQSKPAGCDDSDYTAKDLVEASMLGCEELVHRLLKEGADPNAKTTHGGAALVEAALWGSGHPEIIKLLLDAGADINQTSSSGWTALIAAVFGNRSKTIDLLLGRGADVNVRSQEGRSALVYAVLRLGNKAVVKNLLAHGADVNVEDGYGKTPLMIAQEANNESLIRMLRKAGARR